MHMNRILARKPKKIRIRRYVGRGTTLITSLLFVSSYNTSITFYGSILSDMKINHFFLCVGLFSVVDLMAQTNAIDPNTIVSDGNVYAIEKNASNIYLAGSFSHVGPSVTGGIAIDLTSGSPDLSMVMPTGGSVRVAVPDGSGGWYIGGEFNAVNGQTRWAIARINADGSLNDWSSNTNLGGILFGHRRSDAE